METTHTKLVVYLLVSLINQQTRAKVKLDPELVETVRNAFYRLALLRPDKFHDDDLATIRANPWWVERELMVYKTAKLALDHLVSTMEWRKTSGLHDLTDTYFPKKVVSSGFLSIYKFKDKKNRTVMWSRMSKLVVQNEVQSRLTSQYVIHTIEKLDRNTSHQGWAGFVELAQTGIANFNMEVLKSLAETITYNYPRGPKYIAVIDVPRVVQPIINILLTYFNSDFKKAVVFITQEELPNYLDKKYIPKHLQVPVDG